MPMFKRIAKRQIDKSIEDPQLRAKVTPKDEMGCKRIMLTDDWYPTLTKPNVGLIADRIDEVTPAGIRAGDGVERPYDAIVLATGFATHGFVAPMEIVGAGGSSLSETWADVPRAYLGLSVPGFPNMFLLYGPNTNGGSGSVISTLEAGSNHLIAALREMDRAGADRIEITRATAERFDHEVREALAGTVWHAGCTNWYVDAKGNDPNQWPWLWTTYRRRAAQLEPGAYAVGAPDRERELAA